MQNKVQMWSVFNLSSQSYLQKKKKSDHLHSLSNYEYGITFFHEKGF